MQMAMVVSGAGFAGRCSGGKCPVAIYEKFRKGSFTADEVN